VNDKSEFKNPETARYWESLSRGIFLIKRCQSCGQAHFYPRAFCPICFSAETVWEEPSGRGAIYSFSVIRKGDHLSILAYVTLAEGPTIMTNIVDCDPSELTIDQPVKLLLAPPREGKGPGPVFTPLAAVR
jgi:uncharacterized OB-fold protein